MDSAAPRETPQQDRAAPRTEAAEQVQWERCPVCGSDAVVRLPEDWQDGRAIPIVGCGNPWHYATQSLGDSREAAAAPALDRIVAELLGVVGFLRSCIASGESLSAVDIERLDNLRDRVWEYQRLAARAAEPKPPESR